MSGYDDYRRRKALKKKKSRTPMIIGILLLVLAVGSVALAVALNKRSQRKHSSIGSDLGFETAAAGEAETAAEDDVKGAQDALSAYMNLLADKNYEGMYDMLSSEKKKEISQQDFLTRNKNIYEGIGARDFTIKIQTPVGGITPSSDGQLRVSFTQTMMTDAGQIAQDNNAAMRKEGDDWKVEWTDALIFPDLTSADNVRISTNSAARGSIYDRNGVMLAGTAEAIKVGLVQSQMDENSIKDLAKVLDMKESAIQKKMEQSWVTDDVFVPIKTVDKLTEQELLEDSLSSETKEKQRRDEALAQIAGVVTQDTTIRKYPLGEITAHLIGYVQTITSEELDADEEGVYSANSQIGKVGLESLYESRLRGKPGRKLRIVNESGDTKKVLAVADSEDGEDITLTIDSELQKLIYSIYKYDESASAAINPYTGEILALVSTPSYDTNQFITGLSQDQWDIWSNDPATPLINRFRQVFTPGSSFKPVTGAIGMTYGNLDPYNSLGTDESWQKDESWGSYKVTTIHAASPAKLVKALTVSDNVYFAKAAVNMGAEAFEEGLAAVGFREKMPCAIEMAASEYSNTDHIDSEIQLADSGYGQGQMQVNPLHLLSIYSAFVNKGSMITPVLELADKDKKDFWKTDVFSEDAVSKIKEGLRNVVSSGTATKADISGLALRGKTGTAEIKKSQTDTTGTELGWFTAYTTELGEDQAFMLTTMVEDVKDRGGSSYVVERNADIFRSWCLGKEMKGDYAESDDDEVVAEPYEEEELDPDSIPVDLIPEGDDEELDPDSVPEINMDDYE